MRIFKIALAIVLLIGAMSPISSMAGSKGFASVMINIGDADFYTSPTYEEFSARLDNDDRDHCWEQMHLADGVSGLEFISKKNRPPGMTIELAKNIWQGKNESIETARKAMRSDSPSRKETPAHQFHGLYIIKPEGNKISMMGVGINAGKGKDHGISQKIEITIDPKDPKKSATAFEKGLCRVSKPFNIGFSI